MATSLGRLVLDMAADAAGFERDMQRVSKSAKKELNKVSRELWKAERDLDRARSKVNRLAGAMAAVGAIAIGGAVREFRKLSQEADRIQKLGIATGLSAEAIQELGFAAEQSGSNLEGLVKGVQQLQKNIVQARDGLATYTRAFERVGVSIESLNGLSADEQFMVLAQAISEVEDPTARTATAMELLGRAGKDLIPLLNQGSAGVEKLREQMRRTGAVMSQETVDATAKFNDAMNVLSKNVAGLRNQFFADLIEPLAEYAEFLATTEAGQQVFQDMLEGIADAAKTLGTVIGIAFVGALGKAIITMAAAEVRVTRLAIAKAQATAAAHGYTTAATRAAIATTALGRAVNIALGPIGIAIGILSTLGITYLSLRDEVEAASEEFDEFANRVDRAANSTREFTAARLEGDLIEIAARLSEINDELEEMGSKSVSDQLTQLPEGMTNPVGDIIDEGQAERVRELRQEKEKLQAAAQALSEDLENLANAGDRNDAANKRQRKSYRDLSAEAETFATHLEDLSDRLAGKQAQALRSFTRQVQHATGLFQAGAIGIEQYANALRLYHQELNVATRAGEDGIFPDFGVLDAALDGMREIREEMEKAARIEWRLEGLQESFNPIIGMLNQLQDDIDLIEKGLQKGLIDKTQAGLMQTKTMANAAFGAITQSLTRSSKEYEQMAIAQQVVNTALGIAAILTQGQGDPYSAPARMAAMAAMVASLGVSIAGMSGGGGNLAARRQETQGTGTVLGDASAKSESISKDIKITADATSKLVGINRGMLHALQTMQEGIAGAATQVARGALDFDLSTLSLGKSDWGFTSTKLADQGIALIGGAISDMVDGAVAQAFATTRKSNLFSTKYRTRFEELDSALNDQINLIFESMINTVTEAGEALGIPLDEIQARIAAFEVQAQEISLKGLSAEEQQAELEAVFSRIFDDLASSVIPFIDQFQKIGEGMAETLVRVATSVQVAQEAIKRLGLNISDSLSPERMAQVSVGLIEAAGGIEQFITDMENFMSKFAPESHLFAVAQSDITRALEQMNFALPASRQGFWELIQAIDGTTEAGQRQIATLLGLTEAADTYYSAVEEIEQERQGLLNRLLELQGDTNALRQQELESLDESNRHLQTRIWALEREAELTELMASVNQDLLDILAPSWGEFNRLTQAMANQIATARELGASEEQMMQIRRLHEAQMSQFIAGLEASIQQLSGELFGGDGISSSMSSTASSVSSSMDNIRDSMIRALEGVRDWLDSSMLSSTSPLVPQERLDEAERQFNEAFASALGGDVDAMGDLPGLADQFLSEAGGFFGTSTSEFDQIWMQVRDAMQQVADMEAPDVGPPTYQQMAGVQTATESTAMSAAQQVQAGWSILQQIALVARQGEETPAEIAERLGVPLGDLLEAIGEDPAKTAEALDAQFNDVVGGIQDEFNKLLDIESIQILQLEQLRLIAAAAEQRGFDKLPDQRIDPPVKTPPALESGAYVVPAGNMRLETESKKQSEEMNKRLERIEDLIESQNRIAQQTATNTGSQSRNLNDLVILTRDQLHHTNVTRIRP